MQNVSNHCYEAKANIVDCVLEVRQAEAVGPAKGRKGWFHTFTVFTVSVSHSGSLWSLTVTDTVSETFRLHYYSLRGYAGGYGRLPFHARL